METILYMHIAPVNLAHYFSCACLKPARYIDNRISDFQNQFEDYLIFSTKRRTIGVDCSLEIVLTEDEFKSTRMKDLTEKHHKKGGIKKQISLLHTSFCCTQSEISVSFIIAPTLTVRSGSSSHWRSCSGAAWKEPSCACGYWKASLPPIHHRLSIPKRIQG